MEILHEWFFWGESDLFFYGVALIVLSALLPWSAAHDRKNRGIIIAALILYGICEVVVTFWWQDWLRAFICLFVGGAACCVAVGRLLKLGWLKINMSLVKH